MDVAKEAQVSIATASRVLNGSTRKVRNQSYVKVMEAATKLNYRPNAYAQAVAKGTAPNIVLLVSDISDPYFASVSQGVVKAAAERGISVTIGVAATPHEELEAVRKSVSTRPRGIIISESEYTDAPERQALQTELTQYEASGGRAVFVLNRNLPFPAVDVANDVGARAIAKLIVDSGYTRPAILKGDDAHRSSKERLASVMEVLDEAGITVDPKAVANGKFSRTDGYAAVMQMARSGLLKPGEGALYDGKGIDSIIALNDVMAIGAMTALRANGIEPGREIGVTGFGDIPYSADVFPPLTTVHLPLAEMGQAAVDSILSNRDDGEATGGTANRLMLENAAERGRTFEVQAVIDEWQSILHTNKRTVKTMCKLKLAGYRLYYLSNIPQDVIDEIRQRDFFPLFDGGIASCEVHLSKPDPKIFGLMMQKYGLAYDETIFVDDTKVNAQAAYNLGITGILYKGPKSFQRALGLCGVKMEADNKRQAAPEAPTENRG